MLRIAVDARPLSQPNTGIGRYLAELLPRLVNRSNHLWHLYSDQPIVLLEHLPNTVFRCSSATSTLSSHLQAQLQFSSWAIADKCDLYWSPRHQLPIRLSKRIPLVVTVHDLVFKTHPSTMTLGGRYLERLLTPSSLRNAHTIITSTNYVREEIQHWFPDQTATIKVIPLSSSLNETDLLNSSSKKHSPPYIVFCGTMEPRKNLDRFITAFAELKQSDTPPPHRLVLVSSSGWRRKSTLELIERHAQFITMRTALSEAEKARVIANSAFLVLPSLAEGFGIPLVEAMKLGVPVLTSNTTAMPEVAGDAATYVDPLDQADLKRGLSRMLGDDGLRRQLAARARTRSGLFDWQTSAEQTLAALEQAAVYDHQ